MSWSSSIRRTHRWLSIAFTVAVILNLALLGNEELGMIVGISALIPLVFLLLSGLYLFALPYISRWSSRRRDHAASR
jgi:uncharacterized membrane protein YhaH (DUF805 family)